MNNSLKVVSSEMQYGDARFLFFKIDYVKRHYISEPFFHCHNVYELHIVTSGSRVYQFEKNDVSVGQNQLMVIPPVKLHKTVGDTSGLCVLSLALQRTSGKNGFYKYFKTALANNSGIPINLSERLVKLIEAYCKGESKNGIANFCHEKSLLGQIVFELFDCIDGFSLSEKIVSNASDGDSENNIAVMLDNLINDSSCDINHIAEVIGYSVRHTSRLINKLYGTSLTEMRKQRALINESKNKR